MYLLSKGSFKHQFATGLAAALLLSGVSATSAGSEPTTQPDASKNVESVEASAFGIEAVEMAEDETQSTTTAEAATSSILLSTGTDSIQPISELSSTANSSVLVYPHNIDGRQAATLYVQNIPVLTFIGTEVDSLSNRDNAIALASTDPSGDLVSDADIEQAEAAAILDSDPVRRATALGEQLDPEAINAEDISVRWHEETEGFIVTLADEDLIALDSRTVLADTTEHEATDAIQVTNRLRRLLGEAEPISEIEGMPEPEPVVEVAPQQTVAIVSSNVGSASWYGPGFHGRLSASGEVFNQYDLTAAHRTLPFGTRVLVTNMYNGRQVTVRINDRGPYSGNRIIDLSAEAAAQIGLIDAGVGTVQMDVLAY